MREMIDYIHDELAKIERKAEKDGKLSMTEIQYADTLAHLEKNLLTAEAMTEDSGYSRGGSYARGRTSRRDMTGRYTRNYDRGGYSRAEDDVDSMIAELRDMMHDLPQDKRQEVQRFIQKMEMME